jgi:hypothetical protein
MQSDAHGFCYWYTTVSFLFACDFVAMTIGLLWFFDTHILLSYVLCMLCSFIVYMIGNSCTKVGKHPRTYCKTRVSCAKVSNWIVLVKMVSLSRIGSVPIKWLDINKIKFIQWYCAWSAYDNRHNMDHFRSTCVVVRRQYLHYTSVNPELFVQKVP